MKISCIITDDEPYARKGLQGYIEKIDFLNLVGVCENAVELNTCLKNEQVDLVFLDIEMPYMRGTDFIKNLSSPPKIIFTTAYEKYALQGFELEVIDYLLKPIAFERFLKASNKAFEYFQFQHPGNSMKDHIFIKADNKLEKINFDEILFAEALENYVAIYTQSKKIISHITLKSLSEKLPPRNFAQPHKSFIVSIDKIDSIEGRCLHIANFQVPISKYQRDEIMEIIVNKKLLKR